MILVIKGGKVIAYHNDNQEDVIKNKYPGCELIKIADNDVQFDEEGWPLVPQSGIRLNMIGTTEQRLADLEAALIALLGGGA